MLALSQRQIVLTAHESDPELDESAGSVSTARNGATWPAGTLRTASPPLPTAWPPLVKSTVMK